jgi:hypothetical protein
MPDRWMRSGYRSSVDDLDDLPIGQQVKTEPCIKLQI